MVNSGSAALIAKGLVAASRPAGKLGLQIVIYAVTVLFSACVTNNAAVTIMFPIAYQAAIDAEEDFLPYVWDAS
jgi:di/tricarboxylate transporter